MFDFFVSRKMGYFLDALRRLGKESPDLLRVVWFLGGPKKSLGSFLEMEILVSAVLSRLLPENISSDEFLANLLFIEFYQIFIYPFVG